MSAVFLVVVWIVCAWSGVGLTLWFLQPGNLDFLPMWIFYVLVLSALALIPIQLRHYALESRRISSCEAPQIRLTALGDPENRLLLPIVSQLFMVGFVGSLIMDGGRSGGIMLVAALTHWIAFGIIAIRRPRALTPLDTIMIRVGFWLYLPVAMGYFFLFTSLGLYGY